MQQCRFPIKRAALTKGNLYSTDNIKLANERGSNKKDLSMLDSKIFLKNSNHISVAQSKKEDTSRVPQDTMPLVMTNYLVSDYHEVLSPYQIRNSEKDKEPEKEKERLSNSSYDSLTHNPEKLRQNVLSGSKIQDLVQEADQVIFNQAEQRQYQDTHNFS